MAAATIHADSLHPVPLVSKCEQLEREEATGFWDAFTVPWLWPAQHAFVPSALRQVCYWHDFIGYFVHRFSYVAKHLSQLPNLRIFWHFGWLKVLHFRGLHWLCPNALWFKCLWLRSCACGSSLTGLWSPEDIAWQFYPTMSVLRDSSLALSLDATTPVDPANHTILDRD